jgi:hypothetical protein
LPARRLQHHPWFFAARGVRSASLRDFVRVATLWDAVAIE